MIQSGWVGDVAGLFFFSRQNYFQYALMRWVQTTPSFLFFRPSLSSLSGAPQWFVLPVARGEAHGTDVNHGKFCKECLQMFKHIVVGRYYVNKPLDYAYIKIYSLGRYIGNYPPVIQPSWYHRTDGILFIPHTCMMTTGVAG